MAIFVGRRAETMGLWGLLIPLLFLGVAGDPLTIYTLNSASAVLGSAALLKCRFNIGGPINLTTLQVQWYFSEQRLVQYGQGNRMFSPRMSISEQELLIGNASLGIEDINLSDQGRYKCVVRYGAEQQQSETTLYVLAAPRLSVPRGSAAVDTASSFPCHVWGFYPGDVAVAWLRDGQVLSDATRSAPQMNPDGTFNLTLTYTFTPTARDSGSNFSCRVSHSALAQPLQEGFTLDVTGAGAAVSMAITAVCLALLLVTVAVLAIYCWRRRRAPKGAYKGVGETPPEEPAGSREEMRGEDKVVMGQDGVSEAGEGREKQPLLLTDVQEQRVTQEPEDGPRVTGLLRLLEVSEICKPESVTEGEEATLSCRVTGHFPGPLSVSWLRRGRGAVADVPLHYSPKYKIDHGAPHTQDGKSFQQETRLSFTPLAQRDQGAEYICRVGHVALQTPVERRSGELHVAGRSDAAATKASESEKRRREKEPTDSRGAAAVTDPRVMWGPSDTTPKGKAGGVGGAETKSVSDTMPKELEGDNAANEGTTSNSSAKEQTGDTSTEDQTGANTANEGATTDTSAKDQEESNAANEGATSDAPAKDRERNNAANESTTRVASAKEWTGDHTANEGATSNSSAKEQTGDTSTEEQTGANTANEGATTDTSAKDQEESNAANKGVTSDAPAKDRERNNAANESTTRVASAKEWTGDNTANEGATSNSSAKEQTGDTSTEEQTGANTANEGATTDTSAKDQEESNAANKGVTSNAPAKDRERNNAANESTTRIASAKEWMGDNTANKGATSNSSAKEQTGDTSTEDQTGDTSTEDQTGGNTANEGVTTDTSAKDQEEGNGAKESATSDAPAKDQERDNAAIKGTTSDKLAKDWTGDNAANESTTRVASANECMGDNAANEVQPATHLQRNRQETAK